MADPKKDKNDEKKDEIQNNAASAKDSHDNKKYSDKRGIQIEVIAKPSRYSSKNSIALRSIQSFWYRLRFSI